LLLNSQLKNRKFDLVFSEKAPLVQDWRGLFF